MSRAWLTNQIFTYFLINKTKGALFTDVEKYLKKVGITYEIIRKKKLETHQSIQEKTKLRTVKT